MNSQAERTRKLMLEASSDLLEEEGPDAVTHLRVADAAGVARTTVYRHWNDRTDLVLDTLLFGASPMVGLPDTSDMSVIDAIAAVLQRFASTLNSENGRIIATLIGRAEWDDDMLTAKRRIAAIAVGGLSAVLRDAIDVGDLVPDSSVDMLVDRLIGPLYARRLVRHEEIPDDYVPELVNAVLAPLFNPHGD